MFVFLDIKDYDAFITCFDILMNRMTKYCFEKIQEHYELYSYPHAMPEKDYIELCKDIEPNWKRATDFFKKYSKELIEQTEDYYHNKRTPQGFIECLKCINYAGLAANFWGKEDPFWRENPNNSDRKVERWAINDSPEPNSARFLEKVLRLYPLIKNVDIKDYVKTKTGIYKTLYNAGREFVSKNRISLPYYYILAWRIEQIAIYRSENPKISIYDKDVHSDEKEEIKQVVMGLPSLYTDILKGVTKYPSKDRYEVTQIINRKTNTLLCEIEEIDRGKLYIPFENMLPSFRLDNGMSHINEHFFHSRLYKINEPHDNNKKYIHPYILMDLPFTKIEIMDDICVIIDYFKKMASEESCNRIKDGKT